MTKKKQIVFMIVRTGALIYIKPNFKTDAYMGMFNGKYGICLGPAVKRQEGIEDFKWYTALVEETCENFHIDEFEILE